MESLKPSKTDECQGVFAAFQTAPASPQIERDLLHIIRSLAELSKHPLAPQVLKVAKVNRIAKCAVFGFQEFESEVAKSPATRRKCWRGLGGAVQLPGESGPRAVLVGKREFLEGAGMSVPNILEAVARRWQSEGAWVVFVGWDAYVRGLLKFVRHSREGGSPEN